MDIEHEKQVQICTEWLRKYTRPALTYTTSTSYGFKHIVERWAGSYISNDAFIEAARAMYPAKLEKWSKSNYRFKFKIVKVCGTK